MNEKKLLALTFVFTLLTGAGVAFYQSRMPHPHVPDIPLLRSHNPKTTALIEIRKKSYKRKSKDIEIQLVWRPLGQISPHLIDAVLSAEDDGFFMHDGVEWKDIRKAALYDLKRRRRARGGSTITQQLAKNLYLSPSKNPLRKLRELVLAYRLEKHLTKKRILEIYLNVVEWGPGIFGAEAAARFYYNKPAGLLTVDESVALAASLPNPYKYGPQSASVWTQKRREWVLRRMVESERISVPGPDVDELDTGEPIPPAEAEEPSND